MGLRSRGQLDRLGPLRWAARHAAVAAGLVCAALVVVFALLLQTLDPTLPHHGGALSVRGWYRAVMCVCLGVALAVWTPSVRRRCSDAYIARNLGWAAALLSGWLVLVLVKYEVDDPLVASLMWYLYYIPMLAVPTLGLFCLMRAAALDGRPAARAARQAVVAADVALALLVLTNNAHHLVFSFSFEDPSWSGSYTYAPGYWVVAGWVVTQLAAFLVLAYLAASRRLRPLLALVAAVMGVGLAYCALYALGVEAVRSTNLALVYSAVALAAFETCLEVGIFPSFHPWDDAFSRLPLDLKVVDRAGETAFATSCATPLDGDVRAELARFEARPGGLSASFRLPSHLHRVFEAYRLAGGVALLTEDVALLDTRREQLEVRRAELDDYNAVLERRLEVQMRLHTQRAERDLCEEVERALSGALERMGALLAELAELDPRGESDVRQARLRELRLLLAFCKRRGASVLRERDGVPCDAAYVGLVARELASDLRAVGASCAASVEADVSVGLALAGPLVDCLYACALATVACPAPVVMLVVRKGPAGAVELRASIEPGGCGEVDPAALEAALRAHADEVELEGDTDGLCVRCLFERSLP